MNKKTIKKALLLTVCAILLVVASVMGTLAYLTSQDRVTNTFTAGKVYIKLDEAKTNTAGVAQDDERIAGSMDVPMGNAYHLIPGSFYTKDPTVTVLAGSEECYVRMLVTVTLTQPMNPAVEAGLDGLFTGVNAVNWQLDARKSVNPEKTVITYEYRYVNGEATTVAKSNSDTPLPALFTGITIPSTFDNAEMEILNTMTINIEAQAIQRENLATPTAAWNTIDN